MKNVLEYLENSAALCAEKTAVRDPEESYSYRELTDRARRIRQRAVGGFFPAPQEKTGACRENRR